MYTRKLNSELLSIQARTVLITVVILSGSVAAGLLLTAVSFGMESGELKASSGAGTPTQLLAERAASLAQLSCLVLEGVAACASTKLVNARLRSRLGTALIAMLFFVGLSAVSYAIVFTALLGY